MDKNNHPIQSVKIVIQYQPTSMNDPVRFAPSNINDAEKGRVDNQNMNICESNLPRGFTDKTIRLGFIRKVYLLLSAQLIFTFGIVLIFVLVDSVKEFAKSNTGLNCYIVSYCIFVVLSIISICLANQLRKVPFNYIFLISITLSMTYMLAMISAYHAIKAVLIAIGITLLITVGLTIFAMQTKYDFTKNCFLIPICLCFAIIGFGIACIFMQNDIMQAVYGGFGAVLMALFLAIDTQMILGGKRYQFSEEDYISATLEIYLDICYIFMYILNMFSNN